VTVQEGGEGGGGPVAGEREQLRIGMPADDHGDPRDHGYERSGEATGRTLRPAGRARAASRGSVTVPVLVNAAHRPVAGLLVTRLLAEGGQVRALARTGIARLRGAGVFTAVGDPDDEGLLEAACTGVHTLVHLCGGLGSPDPDAVVAEGRAVAAAAEGAGVARILLVTLAGAAPTATDALRRAHATVSEAVAAAAVPSIEVRVGLVDTPAVRRLLRAAGPPADLAARPVLPIAAADLVEVLVGLDAARSRATEGHLRLTVAAPPVPLADLLGDPGGGGRRGGRLPDPAARVALLETLAGPWREPDPDVLDVGTVLGPGAGPHGVAVPTEVPPERDSRWAGAGSGPT
jgi:uncharacterized protein YbjT (DUF2867 family)